MRRRRTENNSAVYVAAIELAIVTTNSQIISRIASPTSRKTYVVVVEQASEYLSIVSVSQLNAIKMTKTQTKV